MKIDNSFSVNTHLKTPAKPAFGAVHPARYFIKNIDNTYTRITDVDAIKLLQRKIVGFLNKYGNDYTMQLQGKAPKKETPADKTLRERLMRFFVYHDRDYAQRRVVCSFYDTRDNTAIPYIFTGNSTDEVTALAKPIGQLKSALHSRIRTLCSQHHITSADARRMLPAEEDALYRAQTNYYRTLYRIVKEEVKPEKVNNTCFDAFFEPVKKGKKNDYRLVNAEFKSRMI